MSIKIDNQGGLLKVAANIKRIDGNNLIFKALVEENSFNTDEIEEIQFDLKHVEYLNSLGIAEFISLHRYFVDITGGKIKFIFNNIDPKIYTILTMVDIGKLVELNCK